MPGRLPSASSSTMVVRSDYERDLSTQALHFCAGQTTGGLVMIGIGSTPKTFAGPDPTVRAPVPAWCPTGPVNRSRLRAKNIESGAKRSPAHYMFSKTGLLKTLFHYK